MFQRIRTSKAWVLAFAATALAVPAPAGAQDEADVTLRGGVACFGADGADAFHSFIGVIAGDGRLTRDQLPDSCQALGPDRDVRILEAEFPLQLFYTGVVGENPPQLNSQRDLRQMCTRRAQHNFEDPVNDYVVAQFVAGPYQTWAVGGEMIEEGDRATGLVSSATVTFIELCRLERESADGGLTAALRAYLDAANAE